MVICFSSSLLKNSSCASILKLTVLLPEVVFLVDGQQPHLDAQLLRLEDVGADDVVARLRKYVVWLRSLILGLGTRKQSAPKPSSSLVVSRQLLDTAWNSGVRPS